MHTQIHNNKEEGAINLKVHGTGSREVALRDRESDAILFQFKTFQIQISIVW